MNRFRYIGSSVFKNIFRFKFISGIRAASVYLCLFIMAVIVSLHFGAHEYINGSNSFKNISNLNLYVAKSRNEDVGQYPDDVEFEFYASQNRIVFQESYLGGVSLSMISLNYPDLYRDFFKHGQKMRDHGECIIGENLSNKHNIRVNDVITIGNKNFTVSGITKLPRFSQKILVSDPAIVEIGYPKFYFFDDESTKDGFHQNHLYSHDRVYSYFTEFLNDTSIFSLIVTCFVVLFYSLMSITNIYKFYLEKVQITNFIQYATGASRTVIFLQSFMENLVVSFFAAFLAYISVKRIINSLMQLTSFYLYLPMRSLLILLFFAFLLSAILAFINIKLNKRMVEEVE